MTTIQQQSPYYLLGGDEAVTNLVERFYHYMDNLPETAQLRQLHAQNLDDSRQKLYQFLSGWLGGLDLYVQKYVHPRLRMRHGRVAIGQDQNKQWMICMNRALDEIKIDTDLKQQLSIALSNLAEHMVNR
jgi:hemoglobin